MSEILWRTPIWVWVVLPALIVLGMLLTRDRQRSALVAFLPSAAFSAYSFYGALTAFGAPFMAVTAWMVGFLLALLLLRPSIGKALARLRFDPRKIIPIRGSYAPMAMILGIFFLRYALNVTKAIRPDILVMPLAIAFLAGGLGLLSGLLLGRTLGEIGRAG